MLNILFVCTGNICRSPMAEQMLRQRLEQAETFGIGVLSAGVGAMLGSALDSDVAQAMTALGVQPQPHVARQLNADLIAQADLVLTATTDHRSDVVELHIPANRYTFTLKEFAAVAEYVLDSGTKAQSANLNELLQETKLVRGYASAPESLDIADPYRRGPELTAEVAAETLAAIEWVAKWLS